MKNKTFDQIALFRSLKAHDGAYGDRPFSIAILCRGFGYQPEDFEGGKNLQVDHFIPRHVRLDPENPFDLDIMEEMNLSLGRVHEMEGQKVIDVIFDKFLPDLPKEDRPSIDNIANLRPLTSMSNNRKSNRLSGTLEMMFETLCGHARGYSKIIGRGYKNEFSLQSLCAEFGDDRADIVEVLQAMDVVDKARRDSTLNKADHMVVPDLDLSTVFRNTVRDSGFSDNHLLQKHISTFENEVITGHNRLADKLADKGVVLKAAFTGSVVDMTGNFRESYDRLRINFLAFAMERLADIKEERRIEQWAGYTAPVFAA